MNTVKHTTKGQPLPLEPGMCIIEPNLPFGDGQQSNRPNFHPFIIIGKTETAVTMVMARTLHDPSKLQRIWGAREINDPCPPMEPKDDRRQYYDATQVLHVSPSFLINSTQLEVCAHGHGWKLSEQQTREIQDEISQTQKRSTYCTERYYPPMNDKRPMPSVTCETQHDTTISCGRYS